MIVPRLALVLAVAAAPLMPAARAALGAAPSPVHAAGPPLSRDSDSLAPVALPAQAPQRAPDIPAPPVAVSGQPALPSGTLATPLPVQSFRVVESYSGPVSYYQLVNDTQLPFIRAVYRPPLETVTLGIEVPDALRQRTLRLRWRWRAETLPREGNECRSGHEDSAAAVYVSWKRGLKWYSIKYVWSATAPNGETCDKKRNLFVVQDTVVTQSGGPLHVWREEIIDPSAEFRKHFENGDPRADVPDFIGVGLMSDGDQTHSPSAADYAAFEILHAPLPR